jgi:hypothetical protein
VLTLFGGADLEIVADRAADILFSLFPSIPFGLAGPVYLAGLATIHFWVGHSNDPFLKT